MPLAQRISVQPNRFVAFCACLGVLTVALSYLVLLGVAFACVYLPYLILTETPVQNINLWILMVSGVVVAATILYSMWPRRDRFIPPGVLIDLSAHPAFSSEVHAIAASLGEDVPREIYLTGDVNASVADQGGIFGFGSHRIMAIGLPLLSVLTVSEFRAVLAHEFAHYFGGDTKFGPWVYKTQTALIRSFQNIASIGWSGRLPAAFRLLQMLITGALKWYFVGFLRLIRFISRIREFRADELAALVAGSEAMAQGLRKIGGASAAWPTYWDTEVGPILSKGGIPAIGDGFVRFMAAPRISAQLTKIAESELSSDETKPFDTHPPLKKRLAALKKIEGAPLKPDDVLASRLLSSAASAELALVEAISPNIKKESLRPVNWSQVAETVIVPSWRSEVREHRAILQGVRVEDLAGLARSLHRAGAQIPDPKGTLLSPQQRAERAARLYTVAVCLLLLDKGWQLDVQPGMSRMYRGDDQVEPLDMINNLRNEHASSREWAATCQRLGIAGLCLDSSLVEAPITRAR